MSIVEKPTLVEIENPSKLLENDMHYNAYFLAHYDRPHTNFRITDPITGSKARGRIYHYCTRPPEGTQIYWVFWTPEGMEQPELPINEFTSTKGWQQMLQVSGKSRYKNRGSIYIHWKLRNPAG